MNYYITLHSMTASTVQASNFVVESTTYRRCILFWQLIFEELRLPMIFFLHIKSYACTFKVVCGAIPYEDIGRFLIANEIVT